MITVSIVEDLPEIRNGLAKLILLENDLQIGHLYDNGEQALYHIAENPVNGYKSTRH
jgi:YesN/AraC family two-component response regulator